MLGRFVVGIVLSLSIWAAGFAQATDAGQFRVTLRLQNADLQAAIQALMAQTGAQVVFRTSDKEFAPVSVALVDQPLELAVKYVCMSAGAVYRMEPGPVFIISHPGEEPAEKPAEPTKEEIKVPLAPAKAPLVTEKIFMKHCHPKDVLNALFLQERQEYDQVVSMLNWMQSGTPVFGRRFPEPQYYGNSVNNQPIGLTPITPNPDRGVQPEGSNRSGSLSSLFAGQGGRAGGVQGGGGGPGAGAGQGTNQLPQQSLIPEGITLVSYDPTDNSIVVQGPEEDIETLRRLVSMFDVRPKQVMVKVEFITASTDKTESFGIDWLYQRVNFAAGNTPGSFAIVNDPIFVNFASGNIVSRLRAKLLGGEGKVVNAPLITTLNNQPALVEESTQITLFLNQLVTTGNGNIITEPQAYPQVVQNSLQVAPRINRDGTITISVAPTISDLGQVRKGPNGVEFPDIFYQRVVVTRIIKDGDTMVLGGLSRKQDTVSYQKFPILGDLPLVGQFFRSKSKIINDSELLIFITPTTIPDDDNPSGIGP